MSSNRSVCQGLQSCLEPLVLEKRVLIHELVPSKSASFSSWSQSRSEKNHFSENQKSCPVIGKNCETNISGEKSTSWNFIEALTNNSNNLNNGSERVYVHPLDKSSTFSLSPKSLEMCTESLGSETGSNFYSSVDEFSHLVLPKQNCTKNKPAKKPHKLCKKINFPPPLTSISGDKGVKMQSCREGGRLVIRAERENGSYFKAERENGRLRLCLVKENEEVENIDEADEKGCDESENGADFNGCLWGGEWSSSRCNGDESGSKGLPSLPFCVATS